MKNKKPPFEITNAIIGYVAEIAELVGKADLYESAFGQPFFAFEMTGICSQE